MVGMDCSALLSLQSLKVLSVKGWRLYITPPQHRGSAGTALRLTELSTSTWMRRKHGTLLEAAAKGGQHPTFIVSRVLQAAAALLHRAAISPT